MATEADIKSPGKQVWHGIVHSRHHHGPEAAVVGSSGAYGG